MEQKKPAGLLQHIIDLFVKNYPNISLAETGELGARFEFEAKDGVENLNLELIANQQLANHFTILIKDPNQILNKQIRTFDKFEDVPDEGGKYILVKNLTVLYNNIEVELLAVIDDIVIQYQNIDPNYVLENYSNQALRESKLNFKYRTQDFYVLVQEGEFAYNLTEFIGNQLWDNVADKIFNDTKAVQKAINDKFKTDKELDDALPLIPQDKPE